MKYRFNKHLCALTFCTISHKNLNLEQTFTVPTVLFYVGLVGKILMRKERNFYFDIQAEFHYETFL